jgi:hypothetical protein
MSVPNENEFNWSIPGGWTGYGPASLGWIYMGLEPMTQDDVDALVAMLASTGWAADDDPAIDPFTVKGRWHARWTTYLDIMEGTQPNGGKGSSVYETQLTGDGVSFTKTEMWYDDPVTGEGHKGIPPDCGAYHVDYSSDNNVAGPRPGSEAEALLGDGHYAWDERREWYYIVD